MTWHCVAKIEDLPEQEAVPVTVGPALIALVKLDVQVYGVSNVCTHQFALMSDGFVEDDCIECPLHQARFHVPSGQRQSGPDCGQRQSGPDCDHLATYPVKIEQGNVFVECIECN